MSKQSAKIDPLLEPLLLPADHGQADEILSQLIAGHAEPVIRAIIRYKLHLNLRGGIGPADASDLHQEVLVQLLARLQQFRQQPDDCSVSDLRGLTAVIAYRACARWMRRQFPERHALKNRLSYLLTRQRGFALWPSENRKQLAGFARWQGRKDLATEDRLKRLSGDEALLVRIRALRTAKQAAGWSDVLAQIFERLGGPVEFDKLVTFLGSLLGIEDRPIESADQIDKTGELEASSEQADASRRTEKRIFLQRLWEEVRQLPLNQRAALLLNLRDQEGRGRLVLFSALGIATLRQLAEALEMSVEALAGLWNELPLEDARIAELLKLTRQQVINARKSARERLTRRLRGFI